MTTDLKEKSSVAALVNESARWWSPDRETTQEKRSRVEKKLLFPIAPLLADQFDGLYALRLLPRHARLGAHVWELLQDFADVFHRVRRKGDALVRRFGRRCFASTNRAFGEHKLTSRKNMSLRVRKLLPAAL